MHQSEPMTLKSKKGTKVMARQAKLMDAPVTRFDGREDQVSATRRTLKQMNEAADPSHRRSGRSLNADVAKK
jgi:hypothetical protein